MKERIPLFFAVIFGLTTLIGLLLFPALAAMLLNWAGFLVALALILGVLNLLAIHLRRMSSNIYSLIVVLVMLLVFGVATTDAIGISDGASETLFALVQQPLEAALGALLVFFLLFAGMRLMQRQRTGWGLLFVASVLFGLLATTRLPAGITPIITPVYDLLNALVVTSGVRGILLGIALGTIMLSIRLLVGVERPYSK